jgi:hypothetical protein
MTKRIAIFQSNYVPWKGFFDLIRAVDVFVLDDDVQYVKQSWRNRNRIKTRNGPIWLTVPVRFQTGQRICEIEIADRSWPARHWRAIGSAYAKAPAFDQVETLLKDLYGSADFQFLSEVNEHFLRGLCQWMRIATPFVRATELGVSGERNERVAAICHRMGATRLLNGPSAREHMNESRIGELGVAVEYASYDGYPVYPQLYEPFEHAVSIIDLLVHCGRDFPRYLKDF